MEHRPLEHPQGLHQAVRPGKIPADHHQAAGPQGLEHPEGQVFPVQSQPLVHLEEPGTLLAVELLLEKGVPLRERLDQRPAWVQFALLFGAVLLLTAFVYLNTDYTAIMYVYENV